MAETKLDCSFPNAQFLLQNYEIRNRKDRNSHGGGLIEYVRKGIICKEIVQSELDGHEIISSEVTIRNKKWAVFSAYRPPNSNVNSNVNQPPPPPPPLKISETSNVCYFKLGMLIDRIK